MTDLEVEKLQTAVASGAAVCLVGAGFSRLALDAYGNSVPSTEDLINEIKIQLDIDSDESVNLAEIADFAEESPDGISLIRKILIARLTETKPSQEQIIIANLPWRALFTTNFDDILEKSRAKGSFLPVTPSTDSQKIPSNITPIYYMHGRARDLLETDVNPSIVISERNYLQLDKRNRDLYARFYNELFAARAVVIIGYSIKDLEIAQGLLKRSEALYEKTYIVCHSSDGKFSRSRLEKFGTVLPVGTEGLSETLKDLPKKPVHNPNVFQFLEEILVDTTSTEVTSDHFTRLIIRGEIEFNDYKNQISDHSGDKFCIERSKSIDIVLKGIEAYTSRFIVSSDFGNGKSVFLQQLSVAAIGRGYRVLFVKTQLSEAFDEIDTAISSGERFLFILDDVVRYREIAKYIGARLTNLTSLVVTTRGEQDERAYATLEAELGGAIRHVDLNILNDDEILQWNEILERWGYWEERIETSADARQRFLKEQCGAENRSIVIALFKSSKIANRIDSIVEFFLRDTRKHLRAFAALLIASLAQRHVTWESIVTWLDLDEASLKTDLLNSDVAYLFKGGRAWNAFTSSQLAEFILRNRFIENDRDILVEVYSAIVLKTADSANDDRSGFDARENLKELMKYRFLTRLFGNEYDAKVLIGNVYRRLSNAPRIRGNPQFWLQFAMSRMDVDNLDDAESYLNTALGLAKERGKDYSPFQILDQQARLYLRKNTNKTNFNIGEIRKSLVDLNVLLGERDYEIIYPFRAVPLILAFIEKHIDNIGLGDRKIISDLLNSLKESSKIFGTLPRSQKGETKVLYRALEDSLLIIRNA